MSDETTEKQVSLSDIMEATKELTKAVTELAKHVSDLKEEWAKWRKAGKF